VTRRGWWIGAAALGAVVLAWASVTGGGDLWHEPTAGSGAGRPPSLEEAPRATFAPVEVGEPGDRLGPTWLGPALAIVLGLALLASIVYWLVTRHWRRPTGLHRPPGPAEPLPDVAAAVRDADAELHDALRGGSPRNAIVACWVRLEAAVAAAGVPPRPADTSVELTKRVLAEHTVDGEAIGRLGELYREARFSTHELGEAHRQSAIAALAALQDELAAAARADVETGAVAR
jgi:Domain of unknown function (DUF4129)